MRIRQRMIRFFRASLVGVRCSVAGASLAFAALGCGGRAELDLAAVGGAAGQRATDPSSAAGVESVAGSPNGAGSASGGTGGSFAGAASGGAVSGVGGAIGAAAGSGGTSGEGEGEGETQPPSCAKLDRSCGATGSDDCCRVSALPGGSFSRTVNGVTFSVSVSDFALDEYEITVGRFRNFVAAYRRDLIAGGSGKNPHNPNDPGWDPAWNAALPADRAALMTALACDPQGQTWTDAPGSADAESRPIQCLDWFEAQAFCIWDGGRLPTDAEWSYAATGGAEQRIYPWGNEPPDCSYANYIGADGNTDFCVLPGTGSVNRVGSESPKGDGRWGHADLAGNSWEWVQDFTRNPTGPCVDCAALTPGPSSRRSLRGGSFTDNAGSITTNFHSSGPQGVPLFGARCARPVR